MFFSEHSVVFSKLEGLNSVPAASINKVKYGRISDLWSANKCQISP